MVILGLTGSIGMGKTETARAFARRGVPVCDSDAQVHVLLAKGGAAVAAIEAEFPGVVRDGAVDRGRLGQRVFGDDAALTRLEAILHPMVRQRQRAFLHRAAMRRSPLVVLDVPLLFETGGDRLCDKVAVVSAPAFLQRQRVLRRPGMTAERFNAVLKQQMPDREKRRRADYVIPTGLSKGAMVRQVAGLITVLSRRQGQKWRGIIRESGKT
ncbi:MAG: dephospho-CoA kinase [Sphingomonadales bacterium]